MASTYVNDLRLNELGTGDASGTWGTITNLNLELIGEGLSYGTQDCFTTDANATTTVADGASDPARAMYFKVTSSATLTATRTLTIAPNTVSRLQFIENATTGGQSINISQGSGSNVTIPTGATKAVYLDGGGSTAAVTDAFADLNVGTIDATTLQIGGTSITATATELNYNDISTLGQVQASKTVTADSSGFVNFGDNERARFGASNDLQLYHDSSNSYIDSDGVGVLFIRQNVDNQDIRIQSDDAAGGLATYIQCDGSTGVVTLNYYGSTKLSTKTDGVDITGELQADSLDIDGAGNISGTLTLSSNLDMQDGDILVMGTGNDLQIQHSGSNAFIDHEGDGSLYIRQRDANKDIILQSDNGSGGDADYIICDGSTGQVVLYHYGSSKLNTKSDGVDVTGELQSDSLDVDGNADISGTLTMGGNIDLQDSDYIYLGTGDDFNMRHDASNTYLEHTGTGNLYIRQSRNDGDIFIQSDNSSGGTTNYFTADGSTGKVILYHYGSEKFRTESDGIYVTGNVQSSSGAFEGASNQDKIVIGASDINFYINNSNEFRMQSDGDFHADADVIAYSTTVSDERLKTDIEKIENATDKVSQLNGYTFTYKADGKKSAGVIAQEVEKVLPSAVREKELPLKMDDGVAYKTVQYDQIIGLLIESIKELKQEINELKGA